MGEKVEGKENNMPKTKVGNDLFAIPKFVCFPLLTAGSYIRERASGQETVIDKRIIM